MCEFGLYPPPLWLQGRNQVKKNFGPSPFNITVIFLLSKYFLLGVMHCEPWSCVLYQTLNKLKMQNEDKQRVGEQKEPPGKVVMVQKKKKLWRCKKKM